MADHCRSCDAPIEWAITVKGSRIPLDIGSHPNANINVGPDGIARVVEPGAGVRISHLATCPNSRDHRRTKPKAQR